MKRSLFVLATALMGFLPIGGQAQEQSGGVNCGLFTTAEFQRRCFSDNRTRTIARPSSKRYCITPTNEEIDRAAKGAEIYFPCVPDGYWILKVNR